MNERAAAATARGHPLGRRAPIVHVMLVPLSASIGALPFLEAQLTKTALTLCIHSSSHSYVSTLPTTIR